MDIKDSQRTSNSDLSDETNHPSIIYLPGRKQFQELGAGRKRNESRQDASRYPEGTEGTEKGSQDKEVNRPDIEYQGLKIDLSTIEWIIVGITAVFCFYLYHTNSS